MKPRTKSQPKPKTINYIKPKSQNQAEYIRSIAENTITICIGPAGSGKTTIAAAMASHALMLGTTSKVIITRPTIDAGKGIGFLPGTATEKVNPYMVPIMEELEKHMGEEFYKQMLEKKFIEIIPIDHCRGRNWHNCFVIVDEASNATFSQLQMLISRIGNNAKMVIEGDPKQSDLKQFEAGGLEFMSESLEDVEEVGIVYLTNSDIVRNKIIGPIMNRLSNASFQAFQEERRDKNKI